jgi:hypothetical protein
MKKINKLTIIIPLASVAISSIVLLDTSVNPKLESMLRFYDLYSYMSVSVRDTLIYLFPSIISFIASCILIKKLSKSILIAIVSAVLWFIWMVIVLIKSGVT